MKKEQPKLDLAKINTVSDLLRVNWPLYMDSFHKEYVRYIKYPVTQKNLDKLCELSNGFWNSGGELFIKITK